MLMDKNEMLPIRAGGTVRTAGVSERPEGASGGTFSLRAAFGYYDCSIENLAVYRPI